MFDSLQWDSTKCAPQYELDTFVTKPTYCVPDFWPLLAFHFHTCKWCLICMIQQAYKYLSFLSWQSLHIEIKYMGTRKEWAAMGTELFIAIGVFPAEIHVLVYQVSTVCTTCTNWPRYLYLQYILDIISGWHHQKSHLHILYIFQT